MDSRPKRYDVYETQLKQRLDSMTGKDKDVLLIHFEMLKEMNPQDQHGIIDLYSSFLQFNGMSEVLAWTATVQLSRKLAQKYP